jgi:hypothetical protein
VRVLRVATLVVATTMLLACSREPTASELTTKGVANLTSGKTAHLDGIGSLALKSDSGLSFTFDFKLAGDAELPDKARLSVQLTVLGNALKVETIAVGGKEYTLDAASGKWTTTGSKTSSVTSVMDPLGNIDASAIKDVTEVDRPEVDGRKTRHLRYQADTTKMVEGMRQTAGASAQSVTNAQGTGELWIRIDDSQIVRQLVKVSMDVDGLAGFAPPGAAPSAGKASMDLSLDMRFSHQGEPIPQITAPPVGP